MEEPILMTPTARAPGLPLLTGPGALPRLRALAAAVLAGLALGGCATAPLPGAYRASQGGVG